MGKRSIDFTKERTERIQRLAELMGIRGIYGEIPKALDFGVECAIFYIENLEKITPALNPEKLGFLFNSIKRIRKEREKAGVLRKMGENSHIVTPGIPGK